MANVGGVEEPAAGETHGDSKSPRSTLVIPTSVGALKQNFLEPEFTYIYI